MNNVCSNCIFYSYINDFLGICIILDVDVHNDFSCESFCDDIITILEE